MASLHKSLVHGETTWHTVDPAPFRARAAPHIMICRFGGDEKRANLHRCIRASGHARVDYKFRSEPIDHPICIEGRIHLSYAALHHTDLIVTHTAYKCFAAVKLYFPPILEKGKKQCHFLIHGRQYSYFHDFELRILFFDLRRKDYFLQSSKKNV